MEMNIFYAKFLLLLSILLSSFFIPLASACNPGNRCFYAEGSVSSLFEVHKGNRKLLYGLERGLQVDLNGGDGATRSSRNRNMEKGNNINNRSTVDWELRPVPSGPDPLHHTGASPKKPKITP